jgi:hypothetical protein
MAEHLPFEHLDVVHPALDRPGAPPSRKAAGHRVQVVLEPGGERAQTGQLLGVGTDGGDPRRQLLAVELGEQLPEGADVAGRCRSSG